MFLLDFFNFLIYCYYLLVGIKELIENKLCHKKDSIEIDEVFLITNGVYRRINNYNIHNDWMMNDVNETSILKIYYIVTIDNKQSRYVVCYKYPDNIVFPPYTIEEIRDGPSKRILFGEVDDNDITDLCRIYAGPLQNFYKDIPCAYINKNLIYESNDKITVTYNDFSEYLIEA